MTTTAKPRKPARARAKPNGQSPNGATKPYEPPTKIQPPEEFKIEEHPVYGTKKLYSYRPKGGGEPIVFPHINTVAVTPKFFWKIYALNEMFQSFEWMNQAEVPRDIQARVMDLPDLEKATFFQGWFKDVTQPQGVAPPGES